MRSIVIAPASTGSERSRRRAVIKIAQARRGVRIITIFSARMLIIVVMKLIDPKMDEIPARCREKIARSTEGPLCEIFDERGGYTVHPVPAPLSTSADINSRISAGGRSQNLMLFNRGNAISGAPNIKGISQLPNPPIIAGITMKKIIR